MKEPDAQESGTQELCSWVNDWAQGTQGVTWQSNQGSIQREMCSLSDQDHCGLPCGQKGELSRCIIRSRERISIERAPTTLLDTSAIFLSQPPYEICMIVPISLARKLKLRLEMTFPGSQLGNGRSRK